MTHRGWQTTRDGIKVVHGVVTPGDEPLSPRPDVLYVNASGTVTIEDENGTSVTYNVFAGQFLPISPVKITAATATIIGLR